jgi:nucleoside-diphosphate-sugar epimerase
MKRYSESDLEEIARGSEPFLSLFSGKKILIAGATGFVGSWLISLFDFANRQMSTNLEVFALARTIPQDFRENFLKVNHLEGNVADFDFGFSFDPDCVINAATPSVPYRGGLITSQILNGSVNGTQNLLNYCSNHKKTFFINLSSGIVTKRVDDKVIDLNLAKDAYLHGKRTSEELVTNAAQAGKIFGKNLRLYAFAGPGISLTDHFAVGNFLGDAISGRPITIKGNPDTVRSYLYPTDLIINILRQATSSEISPVEIGSHSSVTMKNLAQIINRATGNVGIIESNAPELANVYLPDSSKKMVYQNVEIDESISRWISWLKN